MTSAPFDPVAILVLADAEDSVTEPDANKEMKKAIKEEIKNEIRSVRESADKYHWIGGFHFNEEWMPFMDAILETLRSFLRQLQADNKAKNLTYQNLLVMVSVVQEIKTCIPEKNRLIESQIAQSEKASKAPYEPINSEMYRMIGEMMQLSKLCTFLDVFIDGENVTANHLRRENNMISYIMIGRRHQFGDLTDVKPHSLMSYSSHFKENIVCLMPAVADEHINYLLTFGKKLDMLDDEYKQLIDGFDLKELVSSDVTEIGEKKIDELINMTSYLQGSGYSREWRSTLVNKIESLRPIIQRGGNGSEIKEAIQYLNFNYYRIRNAYDKKRKIYATPPKFGRKIGQH
uniref:DUF4371 domain-containing protein n=1 Tax=Caenorhabditis tropicalis TaxID=1561998 RepID=A0A1I7URU5_9PELO